MRIVPSTRELEHIRYALDQSAIVATTDIPGRIKYVNDKFCEISKYSREELIGQDHRILNSGHHSKEFIKDLWRTIANGNIWRGDLRNRAKDGSIYWVDTTIIPFLDESGKPWQYMAIRYDITDRKRQEERLRAQATLSTLGEMVAVLAHEVRNPLAGIRGGVQLLETKFPDGDDGRDLTRDIMARIDSLNAVVSDLLSFARVREIKPAPIDVTAFFSDMSASIRFDPAMRKVNVTTTCPPGLEMEADIDQMRIVFTNLLLNSAQAIGGEGNISLSAARAEPDRIELRVADSGPGIAADSRERVFQPFFTTKIRGTGLGLPTAKRIIEAHGGEIGFIDSPAGATVRILLPQASSLLSDSTRLRG